MTAYLELAAARDAGVLMALSGGGVAEVGGAVDGVDDPEPVRAVVEDGAERAEEASMPGGTDSSPRKPWGGRRRGPWTG